MNHRLFPAGAVHAAIVSTVLLAPVTLAQSMQVGGVGPQANSRPAMRPSNAITVQGIDLHGTFHHVGVEVRINGDVNANAHAALEANINGAGVVAGHPLSRVGGHRFVGTVFDLSPGDTVAVRVVVTDPDGTQNGVQVAQTATRSDQVPVSNGLGIHVAPGGSDTNGNGTSSNPYGTIQFAIELAMPGDKLLLHAGTYHQSVEVDSGPTGTAQAPLTITNAGDGPVILDGADPALNNPNAWTSLGAGMYRAAVADTYYIGIDGVRLWRYDTQAQLQNLAYATDGGFWVDTNANQVYMRLPGDAAPAGHQIQVSTLHTAFALTHTSDLVFDGLTFKNYNLGPHSSSISVTDESRRIWVVNSVFEQSQTGVRLEGYVEDTVVMNNEFHDAGVNAFDWELVKEFQWWLEHGALFVTNDEYSGRGTIFFNNYVHDYFDGVKIVGTESLPYASNSDVVGNFFYHLSDDGVETDGYASNVRIVDNRFEVLLVGVSVAPALAGPVYIVRNLMVDLQNVAFTDYETTAVKFNIDGQLSGELFVYHNTGVTFEAQNAGLSVSNDSNWRNLTMENNIWQGTKRGMYYHLDNTLPLHQDYDLLDSLTGALVLYQGTDYSSVASYTSATGLCANCLGGDPLFENTNLGDYRLRAGSPAVDAAKIINGINDLTYNGAGPDIGAIER